MPSEELDLSIPDLKRGVDEQRAADAIRGLPGIEDVRFVSGGAWLVYRPKTITKEQICDTLHRAGFHASTFQDSHSGKTGRVSG